MVDDKRVLFRDVLGARGPCYRRPLHAQRLGSVIRLARRDCESSRPRAVGTRGLVLPVLRLFAVLLWSRRILV